MSAPYWLSDDDLAAIPATEISPTAALSSEPLVSVLMLAYNHEEFIVQAIESILSQQCGFSFELVIGEDCSTDRTEAICREHQARCPGRIRLVTSEANVGMHRNFARIWCRARGRYVALCEGDDYWTDPHKLAKQVAMLEAKPAFSFCGTLTRKVRQGEDCTWVDAGSVGPPVVKEAYGLTDLIPSYSFHTSSVLIRKAMVRFPRWLWDVYCVDRPLYLLCAEQGPVCLLPEFTSVYRLHEGGIWGLRDQSVKAERSIRLFTAIARHLGGRYRRSVRQALGGILWGYASESLLDGERRTARRLAWRALATAWPRLPAGSRRIAKVLLKSYCPHR